MSKGDSFPKSRWSVPQNALWNRGPPYKTLEYEVDASRRVANIKLNRPKRLNAITLEMPLEIRDAVATANMDSRVAVLVVSGSGRAFCSGYDLAAAEHARGFALSQSMPWDPYLDYKSMGHFTECFMSLWRSLKPVVCKVHGYAVAGGSDIALCCDLVVMEDTAKIGYPPARVWGCPTTAMWTYRVGAEKAKYMLLTGKLVSGKEAERMGLVCKSVPKDKLDQTVDELVDRIASVPTNQLFFQKQVVNHAVENMGLSGTQRLATIFDGCTRHSPEGILFQEHAMQNGFQSAVKLRDSGKCTPWTDVRDKQQEEEQGDSERKSIHIKSRL